MSIPGRLAVLALRPIAEGALPATGQSAGDAAIEPVKQHLVRHFTEQSAPFTDSLRRALDRSWKALEVALNGVLWLRQVANPDDKSVIELLKSFVQQTESEISRHEARRRSALNDLKDARRKNYLSMPAVITDSMAPALADGVARYAKFTDPEQLLKADRSAARQIGDELKQAGYPHLAAVLLPADGEPLLAIAARYFFRQAIEPGTALAETFAFAKPDEPATKIQEGFTGLTEVLTYHARRLEELLGNAPRTIIEPPILALILKLEQEARGAAHAEFYQSIDDLRRRFNLTHERVQPLDAYAIHNVIDHKQILSVIDRYRALPEDERRNRPALLNAIAQFELAIGDPAAASRDFHFAAAFLTDSVAKAVAYMNAHRAGLLQPDYATALSDLLEAVKLDGRRIATFPVGKYIPIRILTADEFSTLYLCKHKHTGSRVVVKTFSTQDMQRDVDDVFNELKALDALAHPAIIHVEDCGYVDAAKRQRPFIVTDWIDDPKLDQYVAANGPMSADDLAAIAESVASALAVAHAKNILHRNIKPANLMVKRVTGGVPRWEVKLIDFGLAIKQRGLRPNRRPAIPGADATDYLSPEQLGRLPGVEIGPRSDIYSFGKVCCYALFQTTWPLVENWQSVPGSLAELLERCMNENPVDRPASFAEIRECFIRLVRKAAPTPPITSGFEIVD